MLVIHDWFDVAQALAFFFIAFISLIISFLIYRKDPSYTLNWTFSLGVAILGLTYVFSFLGNLYYMFYDHGDIFYIRTAFFLAPIAFMFFYYTSLGIYRGVNSMYSKPSLVIFLPLFVVDFIIIYVFNGVVFKEGSQTNSISTLPFKIVDLGSILVLYILVYYFFIKSYRSVDDREVKTNLRFFLIGWAFGGLGFLSILGSDYFRILDLIGPLTICLGILILSRSFLTKHKKENLSTI